MQSAAVTRCDERMKSFQCELQQACVRSFLAVKVLASDGSIDKPDISRRQKQSWFAPMSAVRLSAPHHPCRKALQSLSACAVDKRMVPCTNMH